MTHRILFVANQTLGGEEVDATVRERVRAGATELYLLVPVTRPAGQGGVSMAGFAGEVVPMRDVSPDARAYELAEQRLREALARWRDLGIAVDGEVGDEDAFKAVSKVLSRREVDEVVVSTLPAAVSHWLRIDLPSRVHRKFKVPVSAIAT